MKWRINVIGPLSVHMPDGKNFRTRSLNHKLVLSALALAPRHILSRSTLARALFSDVTQPETYCLSVLIYRLQNALFEVSDLPLIYVTLDSIALIESNVEVDVDRLRHVVGYEHDGDEHISGLHSIANLLSRVKSEPISGINHPLINQERATLFDLVFESIFRLSQSPISVHYRSVLLDALRHLRLMSFNNIKNLECTLRTLATLGEKELIVDTFMSYEERLLNETGEMPSAEIIGLLDQILLELDQAKETRQDRWHPVRPEQTLGRDRETKELVDQINGMAEGGMLVISGLSGIGKSHLMKEVYFLLSSKNESLYIDLEHVPIELAVRMIAQYDPRYVFIDHMTRKRISLVVGTRIAHPRARIVCTGLGRMPINTYRSYLLGPLQIESENGEFGAVDLLLETANSATHGTNSFDLSRDSYIEIAKLCDGIPLAIIIAGRLCSTVGPHHVLGAMRRSLESIESKSSASRSCSVGAAIAASLDNLTPSVQKMAALLASLQYHCPVPLFCQASDSSVFDLDELLASGLAILDSGHRCVYMSPSVSYFVNRSFPSEVTARQTQGFFIYTVAWFEMNCEDASNREMIVEATPLAFSASLFLLQIDLAKDSIDLLVLLRTFLGGKLISKKLRGELEKWMLKPKNLLHTNWLQGILTLLAAHFHAGDYESHCLLVNTVVLMSQGEKVEPSIQAELALQVGLSWRVKGNLDRAMEVYEEALFLAKISNAKGTISKALYNLAMASEAAGDIVGALKYLCEAQDYVDELPDSSVVGQIELSIARMHFLQGTDPEFVRNSMENTLAKALFAGNRRIASEVIQNLGLVHFWQGNYIESALHETAGTLMLLESGFTSNFRLQSKSSIITLCAAWNKIGNRQLAIAARMMVDRMGIDDTYGPNQKLLEDLNDLKSSLKGIQILSNATESEVRQLLNESLRQLRGLIDHSQQRNELRYVIDLLKVGASAGENVAPQIASHRSKKIPKMQS